MHFMYIHYLYIIIIYNIFFADRKMLIHKLNTLKLMMNQLGPLGSIKGSYCTANFNLAQMHILQSI